MTEAPQQPVGPMNNDETFVLANKNELIAQVEAAPELLRQALKGLIDEQLDSKYKNWNIRQIVNHLVDSHMYGYLRFKFALTEENPALKAYDHNVWAELPGNKTGDLEPALTLFDGVQPRWARLMREMSDDQFRRTFLQPDGKTRSLAQSLGIYSWHARHHTGQILWMRENRFR